MSHYASPEPEPDPRVQCLWLRGSVLSWHFLEVVYAQNQAARRFWCRPTRFSPYFPRRLHSFTIWERAASYAIDLPLQTCGLPISTDWKTWVHFAAIDLRAKERQFNLGAQCEWLHNLYDNFPTTQRWNGWYCIGTERRSCACNAAKRNHTFLQAWARDCRAGVVGDIVEHLGQRLN